MDENVFAHFSMQEIDGTTLDIALADAGDRLVCVFCWGVKCFNCDVAKKAMLSNPEPIAKLDLVWLHCDVYADPSLGLRLGLHGIPVFAFFHKGRKLGAATGWHGIAQFEAAVANARRKAAGLPLM
jgi:hypothetical protein